MTENLQVSEPRKTQKETIKKWLRLELCPSQRGNIFSNSLTQMTSRPLLYRKESKYGLWHKEYL